MFKSAVFLIATWHVQVSEFVHWQQAVELKLSPEQKFSHYALQENCWLATRNLLTEYECNPNLELDWEQLGHKAWQAQGTP